MDNFKEFLRTYRRPLIGAAIGLVTAILMLTIGFFATLLILLLVGIGVFFGMFPDGFKRIKAAASAIFGKIFKGKQ